MKTFDSLAGFAAEAAAITLAIHEGEHELLDHAGHIIETEAKRVIGTYEYGWPQLAESTQEDRERKGYAPNEPLLREGNMRDSIGHTVVDREHTVYIGSNEDIAVYQELGTSRIPPRPFLQGAAMHKGAEAAKEIGARTFKLIKGV